MERPSSIKKAKLPPIPPGGDIKARFEQYLQREDSRGKGKLGDILNTPEQLKKASDIPIFQGAKNPSQIDQGFTSSLLKRVSYLEKTLESYRSELKIKSKELFELREKVQFYEEFLDENNKVDLEKVLQENCNLKN